MAWYFRSVEIVNKLILTSALLFIAPGSQLQVLSGLALSFLSLMFYMRRLPYAEKPLRQIAFWGTLSRTYDMPELLTHSFPGYLIVFLFFFTGLLIKTDVRVGANSYAFFQGVVGVLLYSLALLPCIIMYRSINQRRSALGHGHHKHFHRRQNLRALSSRISKRLTGRMTLDPV